MRAVAIEGDIFVFEGLEDEVGDDAAIVGVHAGAVGVEDADDADVDAVGAVVVEEECFGGAFAFIVAGADADGVDVAAVGFGLGVDGGVAIDFAGGCLEDFGFGSFGHAQDVDGAQDGDFHGFNGVVLVVDGAGGAGHVEDLIDFEPDIACDIVADEFEIGFVQQVGDVLFLAGEEVIQADDIVTFGDEAVADV